MTLGELEARVRDITGDKDEDYRFSVGFVMVSICEAIERLRNLRPATCYHGSRYFKWTRPPELAGFTGNSFRDGLTPEQRAALRSFVPYIDSRFNEAIVFFAAAKSFACDEVDTHNAEMEIKLMGQFNGVAMT